MYCMDTMELENVVDNVAMDLAMKDIAIEIKNLQCGYFERKLVLTYVPHQLPKVYIKEMLIKYVIVQAATYLS